MTKVKKKKASLYGLELTPTEDTKLLQMLDDKDMSFKQLMRKLLRSWMEENS